MASSKDAEKGPAAVKTRRDTGPSVLKRLIISLLVAAPFLLVGWYSLEIPEVPLLGSAAFIGVGLFLLLLGLYMSFIMSFPYPSMVAGEEELVMRHPTMKPAIARMALSLPFFAGAAYLFGFTQLPYIYPFIPFVIGLFLLFKGIIKYWVNLHITYTVTNRRVINMYRFLWLYTTEIPVSRIISISEARSFFEVLSGRGSVVVASGIGKRQTIRIQDISDPGPVAGVLRELLPA